MGGGGGFFTNCCKMKEGPCGNKLRLPSSLTKEEGKKLSLVYRKCYRKRLLADNTRHVAIEGERVQGDATCTKRSGSGTNQQATRRALETQPTCWCCDNGLGDQKRGKMQKQVDHEKSNQRKKLMTCDGPGANPDLVRRSQPDRQFKSTWPRGGTRDRNEKSLTQNEPMTYGGGARWKSPPQLSTKGISKNISDSGWGETRLKTAQQCKGGSSIRKLVGGWKEHERRPLHRKRKYKKNKRRVLR